MTLPAAAPKPAHRSISSGWRTGYAGRFVMAAAALAVSGLAFGSAWGGLAAARPEVEFSLDEDFTNGAVSPSARIEPSNAFACPDGWCVTQTTAATVIYRPPLRRTGALSRLAPWFYMPSVGSNEIALSIDGGQTFVPLSVSTAHSGAGFSVPEQLQNAGAPLALRFTLDNRGPNQALGLDKLILVYTAGPIPELAPRQTFIFAFLAAGLSIVAVLGRRRRGVATLLVVTLAAALRYDALSHAVDRPMDPDARVYRQLAGTMDLFSADHGFYSANFNEREPGFVFAVHAFFSATHDSEYHLRLLTMVLSVALVLVGMAVAYGLLGTAGGLFVGILLALNVPLIDESVRGLRLEAETIVWTAWLGLVFVWRRPAAAWEFVLAGAAAGLLLLVRSSYGPTLVALIALAAWMGVPRWRSRLACVVVAVAVMSAVVLPHRLSMWHRRGDAFWDTTMYARWLANFEFAGRPGFPTMSSLQVNGYQGPAISYGEYLFGLHTPADLVTGTLRGYYKMLVHMNAPLKNQPLGTEPSRLLSAALPFFGVVGMVAALFRRRYAWLPVAFVAVLAPAAFLYDRALLEAYRHSYQAFPLLLLSVCVPFALLLPRLRHTQSNSLPSVEVGTDS